MGFIEGDIVGDKDGNSLGLFDSIVGVNVGDCVSCVGLYVGW